MGWNSANRIFDPVARALINTGADDNTKRKVLGDLIGELQEGDWDTGDESLEDFLDDPAIVAAFHDRNVHTQDRSCCRRTVLAEAQDRITEALAAKFADGATEADMYAVYHLADGEERTRAVTAQEAGQVAFEAIRDLIGGTAP
ncbi:hypothetical protein ACIQ6R_16195 [Streptomyces sp. NPDC096048]|uniref:hypothetical protein n=1 Tax=Streptomyces sp. NPDC096048 TaxID=3366072 RepID=UPI003804ACE2